LVARTDINFIDLDKDEFTARKAVDMLIQTMEEYANWGFHYIADKLIDDPTCYYKTTAFLEEFQKFDVSIEQVGEEEPDSLD